MAHVFSLWPGISLSVRGGVDCPDYNYMTFAICCLVPMSILKDPNPSGSRCQFKKGHVTLSNLGSRALLMVYYTFFSGRIQVLVKGEINHEGVGNESAATPKALPEGQCERGLNSLSLHGGVCGPLPPPKKTFKI